MVVAAVVDRLTVADTTAKEDTADIRTIAELLRLVSLELLLLVQPPLLHPLLRRLGKSRKAPQHPLREKTLARPRRAIAALLLETETTGKVRSSAS